MGQEQEWDRMGWDVCLRSASLGWSFVCRGKQWRGAEGPHVFMAAAALGLPGHKELKVAISKVLTMGRWGGKRAALNET